MKILEKINKNLLNEIEENNSKETKAEDVSMISEKVKVEEKAQNSILKRRLSRLTNVQHLTSTELVIKSSITGSVLSSIKSNLNSVSENGTPNNKRRVNFCDSVQVEEIEPNFNKSWSTTIVLSPYFAKNNTSTPQTSLPLTLNQNFQTIDNQNNRSITESIRNYSQLDQMQ